MQKTSLITGIVVVLFLSGLAGADYWWKERFRPTTEITQEVPASVTETGSTEVTVNIASSQASSMSSSSGVRVVKKGVSTKKHASINVDDVFLRLQLIKKDTTEMSLLQLVDQSPAVSTIVLLKNNDRALLFSWIQSDDVKTIFSSVKKALQEQFSGQVKDLVDETRTSSSSTPMDILSFLDPAISKEKILFLRIRNRLYEIHIAQNGESVVDQLIEELGK